ncbi:glutathione transferase [Malassezia vespertilionis]|uniref:glutathione transferase n=1 Tax=Malassezia vespertilionis TaxID=2020962 RepID=UPI0024B14A6B|nr:glutathione transferase [Malassezia vespertilionis]WFD06707.1 glutathione transferase [Malassezia vespertilionis]
MPNKLQFYFDCVSPWSYVAFNVIRRYQQKWNLDIDWCPASLSYVMKFSGNKPPLTVPNKGMQMSKELGLTKSMYGVDLRMPDAFPFDTFSLMGFLRGVKEREPAKLEQLIDAFVTAVWGEGRHVHTAEHIRDLAGPAFKGQEQDLDKLVEYAFSREARDLLKKEADQLVNNGAFGFPYVLHVSDLQLDGCDPCFRWKTDELFLAAFYGEPYAGPFANGITPRL